MQLTLNEELKETITPCKPTCRPRVCQEHSLRRARFLPGGFQGYMSRSICSAWLYADDWDFLLGLHALVAGSTHIHILAFRRDGVPFSQSLYQASSSIATVASIIDIERGGLVLVVWLDLGVVGFVLG